jgi:hypothetical protein
MLSPIEYNILKLKQKLAFLETPDARRALSQERRLELIKITTEKFRHFLTIKQDISEKGILHSIRYLPLDELYS